MISPELLRRYPFFGILNDAQLKAVAMITEEKTYEIGETIFEEGQPAAALFLLVEGSVDLYYTVEQEYHPERRKEFSVGEINPGEPFGISTLIEPRILTSTARAATHSRAIMIRTEALCKLCDEDKIMGYQFMRQVAKAAMERLHATRIQLAAAWA